MPDSPARRSAPALTDSPRKRLALAVAFPALLIAAATVSHLAGLDHALSDRFFDSGIGVFTLRTDPMLELVGHQLAKSAVLTAWFALLAAALASHRLDLLRPWRAVLWTTVAAMALGPVVVVAMKSFTAFPCPWSLQRYGGFAAEALTWFATPATAGHCFPAGHSAGGFSLFAGVFAALATGRPRLARIAFWIALATGVAFSGVRIVQGAHFLSHALWAAAIDWFAAALVFSTLRMRDTGEPTWVG